MKNKRIFKIAPFLAFATILIYNKFKNIDPTLRTFLFIIMIVVGLVNVVLLVEKLKVEGGSAKKNKYIFLSSLILSIAIFLFFYYQ